MTDEPLVVLCTVPDEDTAARLARGLVGARLAACVNAISGVRSFYTWRGQLQEDTELQLVIKTRTGHLPDIERWLDENHPYEVPEILALAVSGGGTKYLSWLRQETD